MTASTTKSTRVSGELDSAPRDIAPAGKEGGLLKVSVDTTEAATTQIDEAADITLMLPIHSSQRVHSLQLFNDDLDSHATPTLAVDVGIYNGPQAFKDGSTSYAAYAVIDADAFASAITTLQAANTSGVEVRYEAGGTNNEIAKVGNRLWEILGLASDPNKVFVIGLTVTTQAATAAAGTITLIARHSD